MILSNYIFNQMKQLQTNYWSIKIQNNWKIEEDDSCYSFFRDDGYGVLQISDYYNNKNVLDEELKDFLDKYNNNNLVDVEFGEFIGVMIEYSNKNEDMFYQKICLRNKNLLLYVTYICQLGMEKKEKKEIKKILVSLKTNRSD